MIHSSVLMYLDSEFLEDINHCPISSYSNVSSIFSSLILGLLFRRVLPQKLSKFTRIFHKIYRVFTFDRFTDGVVIILSICPLYRCVTLYYFVTLTYSILMYLFIPRQSICLPTCFFLPFLLSSLTFSVYHVWRTKYYILQVLVRFDQIPEQKTYFPYTPPRRPYEILQKKELDLRPMYRHK